MHSIFAIDLLRYTWRACPMLAELVSVEYTKRSSSWNCLGDTHIIEIQTGCAITEVGARVSRGTVSLFKVSEEEQIHWTFY